MKRAFIALEQIAARENLLQALWLAAKGKRHRPEVRAWLQNPDHFLDSLARSILAAQAPIGEYRRFEICDPKTREIHAACFSDRVLHHAIMLHAGPVLERSLVPHSYACLAGRGVQGQGLPIGSLSSQHFANLYLDGADRLLAASPQVRAMVRYMDDIVWWCADKASAKLTLSIFEAWLAEHQLLQLHPWAKVNRSDFGVGYCGYRVTPAALRLSRRRKRRYVQRRRQIEADYRLAKIDALQLQPAYDAVRATTLPAQSGGFRAENLRLHPAPAL